MSFGALFACRGTGGVNGGVDQAIEPGKMAQQLSAAERLVASQSVGEGRVSPLFIHRLRGIYPLVY